MKLSELKEMAYRVGNLSSDADKFALKSEFLLKDSKYVGDIDSFKVKSDGRFFSMWNEDEMVALLKIDIIPNNYVVVDDLWVKESFRGKKLLAKLLWFLKSRENHPKILLGRCHSDDTYSLLKAGGLSKFKRYWFDPISGSTEEFNTDTVDSFYSNSKKKWSLMLEHQDDVFIDMPRFNTLDAGYISQSYDWQIN